MLDVLDVRHDSDIFLPYQLTADSKLIFRYIVCDVDTHLKLVALGQEWYPPRAKIEARTQDAVEMQQCPFPG